MDVRERLRAALSSDDDVAWAYLLGSAVRGGPYRDLDVAIMPREGAYPRLLDLGALVARLEYACGIKVDVVDLRAASLAFSGPMLRERVVLVDRRPQDRHEWEATTAVRWIDFRPTWERFQEVRREALRRRLEGRG